MQPTKISPHNYPTKMHQSLHQISVDPDTWCGLCEQRCCDCALDMPLTFRLCDNNTYCAVVKAQQSLPPPRGHGLSC